MKKFAFTIVLHLISATSLAETTKRDQVFGGSQWKEAPKEEDEFLNTKKRTHNYDNNHGSSGDALSATINLLSALISAAASPKHYNEQKSSESYLLASNNFNANSVVENTAVNYTPSPVSGYFDVSLLVGGTAHQGGSEQIREAMTEIGNVGPTLGLQLSYRHALNDSERLRMGGSLLMTTEAAEREDYYVRESMSYSSTMLLMDMQYYFGESGRYGSYLRTSGGPAIRNWEEQRLFSNRNYKRSDSSQWGLGGLIGVGYSTEPRSSITFYGEFSVSSSNVLGPDHLGNLPSTQFLALIGLQWH